MHPSVVEEPTEKPARALVKPVDLGVSIVACAVALLVLWQVFFPLSPGSQFYLIIFLTGVLPLLFIVYGSLPIVDGVLAVLALAVCAFPLLDYDGFLDRQGQLTPLDVVMGAVLLLLLLEACRRTTGWALPIVCLLFLGYGYYGGLLPQQWTIAHAGFDFDQLIDAFYNSGSGFYGTPLDVAATYIVLFTIYGAVLELSGAAQFFVDLSVAAFRRSRSAAGRTAVAAGFLLGTVSGSGAATTIGTGAVTWPILRRAGYPAERAGGVLAAAGVGAILSPPTLGAAAFIVAEYLNVSYLTVLGWAMIPTVLYYLGILLAVEIDARRFGVRPVLVETESAWRLLARFGYHFSSLIAIVVLLAFNVSAVKAVVYATLLALALSFLDRRRWPGGSMVSSGAAVLLRGWGRPRSGPSPAAAGITVFDALAAGVRQVLPVAAICAAAGIITAVTTKTGLGSQVAALLVGAARAITDSPAAILVVTALFAALALALLGLAVPVTASFIIGWVIIGPALLDLGVPAPAAAMFVFYFSVLSEVTPPTALASVAASAITGGRAIPTMWQSLRYALPAFLVPLAFVATGPGESLLGRGAVVDVVWVGAVGCLAVVALAVATGGWMFGAGPAGPPARVLAALAGLLLLYLHPISIAIGAGLLVAAAVVSFVFKPKGEPKGDSHEIVAH